MNKSLKLKEYLKRAINEKFAIPAINTTNMETTQAIVEAAKELNSPIILQITESAIKYAGFKYAENILKVANENPDVFIHLDHGRSELIVKKCIESPIFSSVMIDKSKESFEKNLSISKCIKEYAGYKIVEAELGIIGGKEEDIICKEPIYTVPKEAKYFVSLTKVDTLAIAIGTTHGIYKGVPKLNYKLIGEIRNQLGNEIGLVLHGSSGLSNEQIKKVIKFGINKINLDTDIKISFIKGFQGYLKDNPFDYDLRKIMGEGRLISKELIKTKIKLTGAENKIILQ